ncbi:MAG: OmpA family protein [Deltaproteobacteria bacterium]|nr:OmpA family protein [Deltaproteobacteria bacterium]
MTTRAVVALSLGLWVASCGGSPASEPLTAASRLARSPAVAAARRLAPQEVLLARQALAKARRASDEGRDAEADRLATEASLRFEIAIVTSDATSARERIAAAERSAREAERERDQNNAARRAEENRIAVLLKQQEIDRILEEERLRAEADERGRPRTAGEEARGRERDQRAAATELVSRAKVLLVAAAALLGQSAEADGPSARAREAIARAERSLSAEPAAAAFASATEARGKAQEALAGARRAAAGRGTQARLRAEDAALLEEAGAAGGLGPREDSRGVVVTLRGVFAARGAEVRERSAIEAVGRLARAHPTYPLVIEGHTSEGRGAQELSAQRASAVARALEALGIDRARIRAVGLGASHPIAAETLTSARERNERMEIVFVRSSE